MESKFRIKIVSLAWIIGSLLLVSCSAIDSLSGGDTQNNESSSSLNNLNDIEQAIKTGNPALLDSVDKILQAGIDEAAAAESRMKEALEQIYGSNPVKFPNVTANFIAPKDSYAGIPLVIGKKGNYFAAMVEKDGNRSAGIGVEPFTDFANPATNGFEGAFKNVLAWLLKRENSAIAQSAKVAVSIAHGWYRDDNAMKWLTTNFPQWTIDKCMDMAKLEECYSGKDLIIIGATDGTEFDMDTMKTVLPKAIDNGSSVLYTSTGHLPGCCIIGSEVGNTVLNLIGFSDMPPAGNSFIGDSADYANYSEMLNAHGPGKVKDLLTHFRDNTFDINWDECAVKEGLRQNCDNIVSYQDQFLSEATSLNRALASLSSESVHIFDEEGYRLLKILILIGDKMREKVEFSTDAEITPDEHRDTMQFLNAYFSDLTVYYNRTYNALPISLGAFSEPIPDSIPLITKTIQKQTRSYHRIHLTGLYAVPGKLIKVVRTDSSDTKAFIRFNYLRVGAFLYGVYGRPSTIPSPAFEIKAGETIYLNTPFGGPILVGTDPKTPGEHISLTFENAITYPCITDVNDQAQVTRFEQDYQNQTYLNWIGIETDYVSIQSDRKHFDVSIGGDFSYGRYKGNMPLLLADTWTYLTKTNFDLAGFAGTGLSLSSGTQAFCSAKDWDCTNTATHGAPVQQFFNIDIPVCGAACSGNPVDSDIPYGPLGWAESHELGHNIAHGALNIYGTMGEVVNNIFPEHINYVFNKDSGKVMGAMWGENPDAQKDTVQRLNAAQKQANPVAAAKASIWDDPEYHTKFDFIMQMPWIANEYGDPAYFKNGGNDGWEIFTLCYLHSRLLGQAASDWDNQKNTLGLSTYATPPALDPQDYSLIAYSYFIGRDMRPFFDMWGIVYSAEASAQVQSYGFPAMPKVFIPKKDNQGLAPVVINGNAVLPF